MASVVPAFSPMLASSGPVTAPACAWAFEPKLDGWRVLVSIDGDLTVRTRNGHNVTASVPELTPMVEALGGHSVVLDGELVARQGRPFDFYGLAPSQRAGIGDASPITDAGDVRRLRRALPRR
jgi:bifunctional non-homologous end joining protein LigD